MNACVETFPTVLVANSFGFRAQPYFGIDNPDAFEPVPENFGSKQVESTPSIKLVTQEEKEKST